MPPALRVSRIVFVERWPLLHVCHLGSSVPQRALGLVFMRMTVGVGPGVMVKQFNAIQFRTITPALERNPQKPHGNCGRHSKRGPPHSHNRINLNTQTNIPVQDWKIRLSRSQLHMLSHGAMQLAQNQNHPHQRPCSIPQS